VPSDRGRSQILHDVLEADRKPDSELRQNNVFRYVVAVKERREAVT